MTNVMNTVLAVLGTSALRSLFLAAVAGLGLKICRAKSTAVRMFVWRAVLIVSLAMPFFGQLLPPLRIPAPKMFQTATPVSANRPVQNGAMIAPDRNQSLTSKTFADVANTLPLPTANLGPDAPARNSAFHPGGLSFGWNLWAGLIYLSIMFVFMMRYVLAIAMSRRLIRGSREIRGPDLSVKFRSLQSGARIAESELISVPVAVGIFRSVILLPICWPEWDHSKLNAVLTHEASHVVRHDALLQHISILHRAIFWFNPLAWWIDRHLAALSEQASDEAALAGGADRNDYARTLLTFFEAVQTAPGRVWWPGVSMAQHGQAEERLEKILAWRGAISMNLKKSFAIAILVLAVPVVYLVAAVRPSAPTAQEAQSGGASSTQIPAPPSSAPTMPAAPVGGVGSAGPEPVEPVAPSMPAAPASSHSSQSDDAGYSYSYGYDDDERFIIVSGKSDSYTMSGSRQDIRHVERLKKHVAGDFIWFQRDERSYVILDKATVDRARAFWAPQEELSKQQEALGKQQEELGKKQEALGKKMEEVRVNVPDMTAALDTLKAKLQKLGPTASMDQIGDIQSEIGELQSKMGEIQSRAGEQQGKLGEEQGKLGEEQGRLGEQQGELGRRQGELARETSIKMKALLDEAIKNGKAQPEPDGSHGASL
jgi:beta-lactamase regulating signal transducer with metallopeptidase domain